MKVEQFLMANAGTEQLAEGSYYWKIVWMFNMFLFCEQRCLNL